MSLWFIFAVVASLIVALYLGNAYFQIYKRREALKRWEDLEAGKAEDRLSTTEFPS